MRLILEILRYFLFCLFLGEYDARYKREYLLLRNKEEASGSQWQVRIAVYQFCEASG